MASLRQLTARARGELGRRGGKARPSPPPPAAAASSSTPLPAVAYLAHRTRNVQEADFFFLLQSSGGAGADGGGRAGGRSAAGKDHDDEEGAEGDKEETSSFRCRKLVGGVPRREAWVDRRSEEDGAGGLVWRRGCFPDVALYEISPIDAVGGAQSTQQCLAGVDGNGGVQRRRKLLLPRDVILIRTRFCLSWVVGGGHTCRVRNTRTAAVFHDATIPFRSGSRAPSSSADVQTVTAVGI